MLLRMNPDSNENSFQNKGLGSSLTESCIAKDPRQIDACSWP
jgi:hypothetical protein